MNRKFFVLLSCIYILFFITGCGNDEKKEEQLIGAWGVTIEENGELVPGAFLYGFHLYDDGTADGIYDGYESREAYWSIKDDELTFVYEDGTTESYMVIWLTDESLELDYRDYIITYSKIAEIDLEEHRVEDDIISELDENNSVSNELGKEEGKFVQLYSAKNFSDGYAWVTYWEDECTTAVGIMDTTGAIIKCDYPEIQDNMFSPFSNGVSYRNYEIDDTRCFDIINTEGKVIYQNKDNCRIMAEGDGKFIVCKTISSMTEWEQLFGIMDSNGNWVIEPCSDLFIYPQEGGTFEWYYTYIGNSVFEIEHLGSGGILNVNTGEKFSYTDLGMEYSYQIKGDDNNSKFITCLTDNSVGLIDANGNTTLLTSFDNPYDIYVDTKNEVYFVGEINQYSYDWSKVGYITEGKFYGKDGNVLIDLGEFSLHVDDPNAIQLDGFYEFDNERAAILINGVDGKRYIGVLDISGDFCFEPIKISRHGIYSCNTVVCKLETEDKYVFLHSDGTMTDSPLTKEKNEDNNAIFCDGYILDEYTYTYYSTDGAVLRPYVK